MSSRRLQNTIENPTLELKIVSASDVNHIDATDKIDVYAVVSIDGSTQKKLSAKTPIDYDGGPNPTWNHTVKFSVNEREANEDLLTVKVKLYSYWLENENDLYLGEVNISVHDLLASNPLPPFVNGNVNKMKSLTYPLKLIGETKPNAKLSLSYRFKPVPVHDLYPQPSAPPNYLPQFGQPANTNTDPARSGQPIIYSPQFQITGQATTPSKLALELVIKSAKDIRNVNVFNDMDVYASVMICEGKETIKKTKTPIAYSGFIFPTWNHTVKFSFDEVELARKDRLTLVVELMSHRTVMGDKHIGEVKLPIQELIGSNVPSPLTDVDVNGMKLVTHKVTVPYGVKGTLSFTYRFFKEQVPDTTPQYIVYIPVPHQSYGSIPVPHQSYGSGDPVHENSGANAGPSNGQMPLYMPPPYQPQEHQQYSQQQLQPQLPSQNPQPQPQLQQQLSLDSQPQSQSQMYQSHGYHQYSPSQAQLQPQPLHARPQVKPHGVSMAALGLGAMAMGRVLGGALMSDMMSDEVNIYEV